MRLYFAGGHQKKFHDYIKERGGHFLLSYVNERQPLLRFFRAGEGDFFIDSGAFTAHRKGIHIDVDAYCDFLNEHAPYIHIAAQIDTIPGRFGEAKTPAQLAEAPELSWANYQYMAPKLVNAAMLLPIFHQGEDFWWLEQMLAAHVPYIGISPANDRTETQKQAWMDLVWRRIEAGPHPAVQTHAFGMTNLKALEQYPFTSADSTTWLINSVYGAIMTTHGIISISDRKRLVNPAHLLNQPLPVQQRIRDEIATHGTTLEILQASTEARTFYNIDFFLDWEKHYVYRPRLKTQRLLFG